MGEAYHGEQGPRLRLAAARREVLAIGLRDLNELLFGHGFPRESNACAAELFRSGWQLLEVEVRNDAEVCAAPATQCAVKVGVAMPVGVKRNHLAIRLHGQDIDPRQQIHGKPLLPCQQTVAAAGDVSTHAYGVAAAARNGHLRLLVQLRVHIAHQRTGAHLVTAARYRADGIQLAYIDQNAAWIVHKEVFVAVTARSHGGPHARMHRALERIRNVIGILTKLDTRDCIGVGKGKARIPAPAKFRVAGIISSDRCNHFSPMFLKRQTALPAV